MRKTKVLMLTNHYLPCLNSGGPVITMQNIVKAFSDKVDFYFCCLNHDMNSNENYPFETNKFINKNTYFVMYVEKFTKQFLFDLINNTQFDAICCFGIYSIYTRYIISNSKLLNKNKVIVFPMGSFSRSAINHKKIKKELFFLLYRKKMLSPKLYWSFTDYTEFSLAKSKLKKINQENCYFCPDVVVDTPLLVSNNNKGVVFISRIMEIKGLLEAILYLKSISYKGTFDIYGPIEDTNYWSKCQKELNDSLIQWAYKGFIEHDVIIKVFSEYNIFLFPTKGENFGHVIFESLCGGCLPIVTPNRTIWDHLLNKIPYYKEISLNLNNFFKLEKERKNDIADECKKIAADYLKTQSGDYLKMFEIKD